MLVLAVEPSLDTLTSGVMEVAAETAVKSMPDTLAAVIDTGWLAGLNVYPFLAGVTV
jgi:hypothetical protein